MKFDPLSDRGYLRMFLTDRLFSFFFLLEFDFSNFDAKKNSPGSYRIEALGEKLREFFFFFNLGFIRVEVVKKGLVFK